MSDRLLLCKDDSCCVRTVWKSKITPESGLFGPDHFTSYRCPQCDMPLVADPMVAHADEAQDLLDDLYNLLHTVRGAMMIMSWAGQIEEDNPMLMQLGDELQRIAKHLGGNR